MNVCTQDDRKKQIWSDEQDRFVPLCAPSPEVIPLWPTPDRYQDAIRLFGSKNTEAALEFIAGIVHPQTGLAIKLPSDDQSVTDVIAAAFSAMKREELNSEGFEEKLSEAISTCLYTLKLPVILNTNGTYAVIDPQTQSTKFLGDAWGLVHWVRDAEIGAATITPDLDPGMGPAVRKEGSQA